MAELDGEDDKQSDSGLQSHHRNRALGTPPPDEKKLTTAAKKHDLSKSRSILDNMKHQVLTQKLKLVLIGIASVLCLVGYWNAISCRLVPNFIKRNQELLLSFFSSILLYNFIFNLIVFKIHGRALKALLLSLHLLLLIVIFFMDNQVVADDFNMHYGYWASRVLIFFEFFFEFLFFVFVYVFKFLKKLKRKKLIPLAIVAGLTGVVVSIFLVSKFRTRRVDFNNGIYGSSDVAASACKVDDGVMMWVNLIPRKFFSYLTFRSFCKPLENKIVVGVKDTDSEHTQVELWCKSGSDVRIRLMPNIHTFTFDELKPNGDANFENDLQEHMISRTKLIEFKAKKRRTGNTVLYEYDSELYETIVVECGGEYTSRKEVFVHPRKSRVKRMVDSKKKLKDLESCVT